MVKQQTGHDKVSIVFISLGGTIGNAYLAKYCDRDDIDRIVFVAAASDGSYLFSDLFEAFRCALAEEKATAAIAMKSIMRFIMTTLLFKFFV